MLINFHTLEVIMTMYHGRYFVLKVIKKYKSCPCLWQVKHPDYHDREKRNAAMNTLLALFKTKDPDVNLDTVKKKITSLRNCFKKEFNKVRIVNIGTYLPTVVTLVENHFFFLIGIFL